MGNYIGYDTVKKNNPELWAQGESVVNELIKQAEWVVNQYTGYDFQSSIITEKIEYNPKWLYFLRYEPITIDKLNGSSVSWTDWVDYDQKVNRIQLDDTVDVEANKFWDVIFEYTKGTDIPRNVITACLILVNQAYTESRSQGITEIRQGDLTIRYGDVRRKDYFYEVKRLLAPYRRANVYT